MAGWKRLVAGAVIGAVGTLYATNEDLRKGLPGAARDLPETVRRRLGAAAAAAREGSARRREEILKELEAHGADHAGRRSLGRPDETVPVLPAGPPDGPVDGGSPRAVRSNTDAEPVTPDED